MMTKLRVRLALLLCLFMGAAQAQQQIPKPDLVLRGQITEADHQTYREVPFEVPADATRVSIDFEYTGRENKTTIDLGLIDPQGLRGWSGGSKRSITIANEDATPSYFAGNVQPGKWKLLLGIPNIRKGQTSDFTARVWFGHRDDPAWLPALLNAPVRSEADWYRGDLHMHDAHSDASCKAQNGKRVPCPLYLTVQAAAQRGLDFIAITDHNTVSQANAMRELQPYFDRLLLIPGREITTFHGHANLWGTTAPLDFRVSGARTWVDLLRDAEKLQGVVSINHPVRPGGEICIGCKWEPEDAEVFRRMQAVEVVNSHDVDTPFSGVPFWEARLNEGHRMTAVGGSDNHDATRTKMESPESTPIGEPTTVVFAKELSMPAILDGIRRGQVFVDVDGSADRMLDMRATAAASQAGMGETLAAAKGASVSVLATVRGVPAAKVVFVVDGQRQSEQPLSKDANAWWTWSSDGRRHWLRADVRDTAGKLLLIGNPVYINWDTPRD